MQPNANITPSQNGATAVADNELTSVPVDAGYFADAVFMGAQAKMVRFTKDGQRIADEHQQQETNANGVKKWKVNVSARTAAFGNRRGGDVVNMTIGIASNDDPNDVLGFGQLVELHGLWFGFIRQRNGHVSAWQTVERITPARVPAAANSDK